MFFFKFDTSGLSWLYSLVFGCFRSFTFFFWDVCVCLILFFLSSFVDSECLRWFSVFDCFKFCCFVHFSSVVFHIVLS